MSASAQEFRTAVEGLPDLIGRRRFQDMEFAGLQLVASISAVRSRQVESTGLVSIHLHRYAQSAATAMEIAHATELRLHAQGDQESTGLGGMDEADLAGVQALDQLTQMFALDAERIEFGDLLPKSFMGGCESHLAEIRRALQGRFLISESDRLPSEPALLFSADHIPASFPSSETMGSPRSLVAIG